MRRHRLLHHLTLRQISKRNVFFNFPLYKRLLSVAITYVLCCAAGYSMMFLYNYGSFVAQKNHDIVRIHRDRPDTDFCYSVVELNKWYYNETVLGSRAKHFAWGRELEESLEAAGEPVCYCRRYFVKGMEPGKMYAAWSTYVGPVTGSVPIAVAQIRRSRVDAILAGRDGKLLMNPEDIPPEYLLSRKALVTRTSPRQRRVEMPTATVQTEEEVVHGVAEETEGDDHIEPADASPLVIQLEEDLPLRVRKTLEIVSFDFKDVPAWTSNVNISFFDWRASFFPVTWGCVFETALAGVGSEITSELMSGVSDESWEYPKSPWVVEPLADNVTDEELASEPDPFVPLVEVCGEYNPFSRQPFLNPLRTYNFRVAEAPYAFPIYGHPVIMLLGVIASIGQFFLFSPWF